MNKLEKDAKRGGRDWWKSDVSSGSFKPRQCFWSLSKRTENILIEFIVGELPIRLFFKKLT